MRFLLALLLAAPALAQHSHGAHAHTHGRAIAFPDVPGYRTLVCDLHVHTVFSDGSVWPDIRVDEAQRDGLDCLAVTDHLEYQPHADDIPHPDRNRSFEIARAHAEGDSLIVIRGGEITRSLPPGHANAVFLSDVNPLLQDSARAAFEAAGAQDAFVFWNHPMAAFQKPDGIAELAPVHRELIADGLLHGIEVVNWDTYSDEALQIALDHDLAVIGTSDVHGLVDWDHDVAQGGHRPVTLVLARERTSESLHQAMRELRTIAYFKGRLIGREEHVLPLLRASVAVERAAYDGDSSVLEVTLRNHSDAPLLMRNAGPYTMHTVTDVFALAPHAATTVQLKPGGRAGAFGWSLEVLSAVVAPQTHPTLTLTVTPE